MALPDVYASDPTVNGTDTQTHSALIPSCLAGQLLVAYASFDGNPTVTWDNTTAGTWSDYIDLNSSGAMKTVIKAKVADGTEGGKTLSIGTSVSEQSVFRIVAYRDWEGTLAGGLNVVAAAGTSSTPDPPVATDSWGSVERATIAVAGWDRNRSLVSYPTGYDLSQFSDMSGGANGCGLASARKVATEGSQNPGTFSISASDEWVGATASIRGGTAGSPSASIAAFTLQNTNPGVL